MAKSLIGTVNAGFEIIAQGTEAVIGKRESDGQYVAWHYGIGDGKAHYFWGRYGTEAYARECFEKKERGEYSGS